MKMKYQENNGFLPLILISLVAILVHGLAIPKLGYYHDDWYMLWSGAFRGSSSLVSLFSTDRPFMGIIYSGFYALIKDNIWGWHLLALIFRILGAWFFYWILNLVWPRENKSIYVLSSMLFVIFPGFLAQPNAATKVMQLMSYAAALGSIAFTLQAARTASRKKKLLLIVPGLLAMALYLWLYEYMIGLEVMRITLLFWVYFVAEKRETKPALGKVFRAYIPNLVILFVFLLWRVFIFDSSRGPTNLGGLVRTYLSQPGYMVVRMVFQTVKDFLSVSLFAWFEQSYAYIYYASFSQLAVGLLLVVVVISLAVIYLKYLQTSYKDVDNVKPTLLFIIGTLITLGAIIPVIVSNRYVDLNDVYKAYALHPSVGVLIMLLGLVLSMQTKYRQGVFLVLLAISTMTQYLNTERWANYWDVQKDFWWQVSWRAPGIERNTLVMANAPSKYQFQQDYEIWAPLNLIYWHTPQEWPDIQAEILNTDTAVELYKQSFLEPHVRDIYLPKYYSHFLLFSQAEINSCVRAIDGKQPLYSVTERSLVQEVGSYSGLEWINTTAEAQELPMNIFGPEPEHGWCYYYQRAELAKQENNWQQIGDLYDEYNMLGLYANDRTEYFVFVEGLINIDREDEASELIRDGIEYKSAAHYAICNNISKERDNTGAIGYRSSEIFLLTCESIDH